MKIDHTAESWMNKSRIVLTQQQNKKYQQPSDEMVVKGKARRKLEDLKDQKDLESYVKDIWDEI